MRLGAIDFFTLSGLILSTLVPVASINGIGFALKDCDQIWTSMFKVLDASPASINFSEVYSALQTKIVEGQENPLAIIQTAKLCEVQKFCSFTNHKWDGFWFLANGKMWEKLPAGLKTIVTKHINDAALAERNDVRRLNNGVEVELKVMGLAFNQVDTTAFRATLKKAGFYRDCKAKDGADVWAILEKYSRKLE